MESYISIAEIIKLLKVQRPNSSDIILALEECKTGWWKDTAYYQFVDSKNANQPGAEWQIADNIILEHPEKGTIIVDVLKDGRIGGVEFYDLI